METAPTILRPLRIDWVGTVVIIAAYCVWVVVAALIAARGGGWGALDIGIIFGPMVTGILVAVGGVYVIVRMLLRRDYPWGATMLVVLGGALASVAAIFLFCASLPPDWGC